MAVQQGLHGNPAMCVYVYQLYGIMPVLQGAGCRARPSCMTQPRMAHAPPPNTPERLQQWLMHQEIDVLDVVVGLVGAMHLLLRLARVDALEDA